MQLNFLLDNKIYFYVKTNFREILTFGIVGILCFVINISLIWFFNHYFDYKITVTLAYIPTFFFHFLCHKFITYSDKTNKLKKNLFFYFIMLFINYFLSLSIVSFTIKILSLSIFYGALFSNFIIPIFSYTFMKFIVFKKV